ncbi:metal ABC transporter solute-binding protein, Zn/Mn family [Sediminibacillus massiliensis]|uniref:metal ABC transporter solute-binding protein, Zn/Mn family n=1 Tax=Sediminibacillus massiliensis TaxID=1926277 RepID=UPI000988521C|nr:zinc ABC transporter substrate-binding protein [Sediminibacillus massiliensis]
MKGKTFFLLAFLLAILTACNTEQVQQEEAETKEEQLNVYTTLYPLQFFAETIGGDQVEVQSILPPGSDAHTYEPTSSTMIDIAESDAFIYIGAGMEAYADSISEAVQDEDVKLVEAADGVPLLESGVEEHGSEEEDHGHDHDHQSEEGHTHEEDTEEGEAGHVHGDVDPHVWLDPVRSIALAENIKDTLVSLQPEQESLFEENYEQLKTRLQELDEEFHTLIDEQEQKDILVSHAAYGYWEHAYGLNQIAIAGLSSSSEPSQKQIERIIEEAKHHGIDTILFEQNVTPRVAEIVQKEIGAEPERIHNLAVLTEEDIENEEDYFTLMENNIQTLVKALQ